MKLRLALTALFLSLASVVLAQGTVMPAPKFTGLDNSGNPISGGKLCAYSAGTSTPLATYTDSALAVPNANPVILDSAGRATIYLSPTSYKFVLRTAGTDATCATGTIVWTQDNISAVQGIAANVDVLGTAGETLTAGLVVYLSDGSGGKSAGQWYKADSTNTYSSTLNVVGMVPSAITAATTGTVRLQGSVTGLSALVSGTLYYVSTGGSLTSTAPTNRRLVGQADSATSLVAISNPPSTSSVAFALSISQGRLSLSTGTPVTTTDVTAATAVYWTCGGVTACQIALYDLTNWNVRTATELSIAVPAVASQMYDVFIQDNGVSAPTLVLSAWTNDTNRSVALVTVNGVLLSSGSSRQRYVGVFRTTTVAGQTEDSAAKRYVWNMYNRVPRLLQRVESAATWSYGTAAIRQANGSALNQLDFVIGLSDSMVHAAVNTATSSTALGFQSQVYVGLDVTNLSATGSSNSYILTNVANQPQQIGATYNGFPGLGRHILTWLEQGGGGTQTWYGTSNNVNGSITGWSIQ